MPDVSLTEIGSTGLYVDDSEKIPFGWATGKTLKARIRAPNGTEREDADDIEVGDLVIVYDNDTSINVGWGEYRPEVSLKEQKVLNVYDERK